MTTPTETVFFFDPAFKDCHSKRRVFGVKPCSDFVQSDISTGTSTGVSADLGEPFAPTENTIEKIVLPARWAALRSYVLDFAFETDPQFEDFAKYAPGMAPIPTTESDSLAADVVSNHIDELKADPKVEETPNLENLPLGRLVLTTEPEGIRFSTVTEKIVTPGGWIWGKAVTVKFLLAKGYASVEIRPLGFVDSHEGAGVSLCETVEGSPETPSGMRAAVNFLGEKNFAEQSSSPRDEVEANKALIESMKAEKAAVAEVEFVPAEPIPSAFVQKIHSPTPKWTPPQHFIDRFTQMEVELTNLRAEQETLKAEIAAAAALLPAEDRRPTPTNPRVSTRSGSDLANRRNLASAIGLECSAFDRTTLRKVNTGTGMAAAEF